MIDRIHTRSADRGAGGIASSLSSVYPSPLMQPLDDLIAFLRIPSVTGQEKALAEHLCGRLSGSGRPVVLDGSSVVIPPASDRRPLVVVAGHLDTVPPRGNEQPRIDGNVVWGRGAADMKGGLAVIASLLDSRACGDGWARLGAILYAGEEGPIETNDLRRLLEGPAGWAREAELAILLEPTDTHVEVGCLGVVNLDIVFRGEACHSARPWLGRNAIHEALPWLKRIAEMDPIDHVVGTYSFRETASVTMLRAGTARNVIPAEVTAGLNYRYPPGWDRARGKAAAFALAGDAAEIRLIDEAPSGDVPLERPLFAAFLEGSGRPSRAKQAWTDVAQFSERGIPSLNFGPGDPHLSHRDDERIDLRSIESCIETLMWFLAGDGPFGLGRGARGGRP
ncbi:MAG: succinyl-diaminopimelate desuccinylase [Candidatus Eisenbacteria bacterium]|nr:succinyl-diaminopimelate desuccinylase [Candidatus Eisenbacteria bacterium]